MTKMFRALLALAALCLLAPMPVYAGTNSTKANLQTQNNQAIFPNTQGLISAPAVNSLVSNVIASMASQLDQNTFALLQTFNGGVGGPFAWDASGLMTAGTVPSGLCSFTAPYVSSAPRSCLSKMADIISVTDFGADPTATNDSCAAFTNAVNALPAGLSGFGSMLYFPKGVYTTTCFPTIADKAISVVGAGSDGSAIIFTSPTAGAAGLRFTYSTPVATLVPQVRDISLVTSVNQTNGNACISITRPSIAGTVANPGPFISNVYCGGTGTTYWADGITCSWCTFLSVQKTQIVGAGAGGATVGTNMSRGIFLDNSTDVNVYDSHFYFANKGISLNHDSEGLKLDFSSFVMTDWGVYAESNWTGPSLVIANSHFNVTTGGIHIEGGSATGGPTSQGQIHDNLIYRWLNATANPWSGIECRNGTFYGCKDHNFHDNNIIAFKGGGPTGVANCFRLGSSAVNIAIHDNTCRDSDYFIDMGSSTSPTITIYNNHGIGSGNTAWQQNQNPSAIWRTNDPATFGSSDTVAITQGLNATLWNLAGAPATNFLTNASGATTVTDGGLGWPGLIVSVRCADTNTTLQNASGNTKFALASGTNYTCPRVGATISFQYSDQWREIGRAN